MSIGLIYDPRFHTFESWASLMCEAYATQQLAIPNATTDWQTWAAGLKAIDIFNNPAVPGPYVFDNWQDWASAVVNAMNGGQ